MNKATARIPLLEQTIIDNARQELDAILSFHRRKAEGIDGEQLEQACRDYLARYHALCALLVFGHLPDCGMSEPGARELRTIEAELHAVNKRGLRPGLSCYASSRRRRLAPSGFHPSLPAVGSRFRSHQALPGSRCALRAPGLAPALSLSSPSGERRGRTSALPWMPFRTP
ncbi:hypothetical protein [Pseudomonas aeruginosa]|uniref:hypothetical protein n=1 Tax=Pseudomonas aeruginosa TaxID=287 RepID=UPI0008FB4883|nr:hypothetical protein [Pseudomonas aeruginosa]